MVYHQTQYSKIPNGIKARMPAGVLNQIFRNGGLLNNSATLQYFGDMDLSRIRWSLKSVPTESLTVDDFFTPYKDYVEELSHDMDRRSVSDLKKDIGSLTGTEENDIHWLLKGTWRVPPIFVSGCLLNAPLHKLNLLEGNSRLGYLIALHNSAPLTLCQHHKIYVGELV